MVFPRWPAILRTYLSAKFSLIRTRPQSYSYTVKRTTDEAAIAFLNTIPFSWMCIVKWLGGHTCYAFQCYAKARHMLVDDKNTLIVESKLEPFGAMIKQTLAVFVDICGDTFCGSICTKDKLSTLNSTIHYVVDNHLIMYCYYIV